MSPSPPPWFPPGPQPSVSPHPPPPPAPPPCGPSPRPPAVQLGSSRSPAARLSPPPPWLSQDTGVAMPGANIVTQNDLLIVGPGVLGRLVAEKWLKEHPGCKVYGQTASTDHHSELTDIGIIPSLKGSTISQKAPYVIFCAPPSRSDDYPGDLRVAASNWNGEGSFLFTSSTALYDCSDNRLCNEDCPSIPVGRGPRTDVLLRAENVVLEAGGCVLRLAGLYKIDRGAHYFWLRKGTLDSRPDHIINQIHYEDAASLAIAIMKKRPRGRIFLGCDNKPLSRQEIMDAVNKSGKFDTEFHGFTVPTVHWGRGWRIRKPGPTLGGSPNTQASQSFSASTVSTRSHTLSNSSCYPE
ncbi:unnamed protein product [Triticum turgidum subsp. durum]|uniref:Uncharacterized protein n=1 Tax=Triticum turgidum subsp. durum TaxID=4567 RepID=A0A9R1PBS5_TRITD|nr:unnamed protein product [Triticum turgidum subsp. durum]